MADRTEAPTQKRRQEARSRGEVARSPEVNSAISLLVSFILLKNLGPKIAGTLTLATTDLLSQVNINWESPADVRTQLLKLVVQMVMALAPFTGALVLAGILISIAQVGFLVTGQALTPKFSRINPLSGFKRMFSGRAVMDLLKACAKIAVIGYVAYSCLMNHAVSLLNLSQMDMRGAIGVLWLTATDVGQKVAMVMLIIAVIDYVYQRRQHEKGLRMSKQEVIEEMKLYENPIVKSRIRQQQKRMAMQRMMASVPQADVIITNPTHFAVAVRYDLQKGGAPMVVAKGQNLVAQRIKALAMENSVPIVERKPLARALYKMVDVGKEIPAELYQAVAEVLAFIYSLRGNKR